MQQANTDHTQAAATAQNNSWGKGWRLAILCAVWFFAVWLIGAIPAIASGLVFSFLQSRLGTWKSAAAAVVVGLATMLAMTFLLSGSASGVQSAPTAGAPAAPPPQAVQQAPHGLTPFYGKLDGEK